MPIYGVKFRALGQTCYYTSELELTGGSRVLMDVEQCLTLGTVVSGPYDSLPGMDAASLPPILRLAADNELETGRRNDALSSEAGMFCRRCIRERRLDMKLVDVEVFFDRSKLIFYFTAPARIDFRDLVKDLVREYRARIELRQIGVRHETQMVGAVGNCGMVCCCRRYLRKFAPVTIRMAKEQNLFLNPAKISGICGRLLCCLSYEQDNYDNFHRNCPRLGKKYQTRQGGMKVLRGNMFRNSVSVVTENNEELELTLDEWQALEPHRPDAPPQSQQAQGQKARNQQAGDGLLVVSATPENVDDPGLFDDLVPPEDAAMPEGGQPACATGQKKDEHRPQSEGQVSGHKGRPAAHAGHGPAQGASHGPGHGHHTPHEHGTAHSHKAREQAAAGDPHGDEAVSGHRRRHHKPF